MPTTCTITFEDNPQKVCYSGTLLKGSVYLNLTSEKTVRGIFIKIKGEAYCHWSEGSGKNKRSYTGEETYLNERTYFAGDTYGDIVVQPGTYNYTFQCQLPPDLPTSMEGSYGHIRYSACVVFDIAMWPDKEFENVFTVIKPIDLNTIPQLREPQSMLKNKEFYPCCLLFCCTSDPLQMAVRIPVGGYTPGQTINLDIDANNKSDQDVEGFTAQLLKHITYHIYAGSSRQKEETILITENQSDGCLQARSETYRLNLQVPPIPPTDDTTSNICKVRYFIRVYGSVACCHSDPTIKMPVIIGSIPILDTHPQDGPGSGVPSYNSVITSQPVAPPLPNAHDPLLAPGQLPPLPYPPANGAATAPAFPQPYAPSAPLYGNADPPTYEEATHTQNADKDNEKTSKKFNPKYPMFRRNTSYSSNN